MFTGLVQHIGVVRSLQERPFGRRLELDAQDWSHRPAPGASVCVSGCCLTLAEAGDAAGTLRFDVVAETLAVTTLGSLARGSRVNLEPSLRVGDELGGHFVQGHVDGVGRVTRVRDDRSDWRLEVEPPARLMPFMAPKGSIAIDGVSLTIAALSATSVEVALIPTTLDETTLGSLSAGGACNIEADMLAKTVVHALRRFDGDGAGPG